MALLGNMDVFQKNPGRSLSGQSLFGNRSQSNKSGSSRNIYSGDYNLGFAQFNAVPNGYVHPYCYIIALKSGGMATYRFVTATGEITSANLAGGRNALATLTGSGDITSANGALIVSATATLSGNNVISGNLLGILNASATLSGNNVVTADLGALAFLVSTLSGSGDASLSAAAQAFISANINVTGDVLTTANVADAIWNAIAASYNTAGTMGNKLNSAGAAGDPWGTNLPGTYSSGTAGYILGTLSGPTYAQAQLILKILRNKTVTDPDTGIMTVYEDDGATVLYTGMIYSDVAGTQTYSGGGINRRDRLA
jgi:hypothetical protein